MRKNLWALALLTLLSCGAVTGPGEERDNLLGRAWSHFEIEDYQTALNLFNQVISSSGVSAEAYMGAGFCKLRLRQLQGAVNYFNQSLNSEPGNLDSRVGRLFTLRESNQVDFQEIIDEAHNILHDSPGYIFSHDPGLNHQDLHLLAGQCSFYLGNLDDTYAELLEIDGDLSLSPDDSTTWIPWITWDQALLKKLEEFTQIYGTD